MKHDKVQYIAGHFTDIGVDKSGSPMIARGLKKLLTRSIHLEILRHFH